MQLKYNSKARIPFVPTPKRPLCVGRHNDLGSATHARTAPRPKKMKRK